MKNDNCGASLFFVETAESQNSPTVIEQPDRLSSSSAQAASERRTGLMTFNRRARYMARFIYWTVRHRSTANVRWVLAYEGFTWN